MAVASSAPPALQAKPAPPPFREELVERLPQLRAFCRFLCRGDAAAADDLAQETVTRAWAARASFTPGTTMRAWLFVIARNLHYSEKRRARFVGAYDPNQAELALKTDPAQDDVLALDEVRRALDLLPNEQRDALVLVTAGGLSSEEAAQICGCAVGTIKSRVSRARAALTEIMKRKSGLPKADTPAGAALDLLIENAQRLAEDR
ncbi:MAG: sigma-70 family RNA polymerase sigma factor [Hyphomonadaceae bacterium]|nr:sigma-70 family RNA polymerase sigma factor [Hyphomonadaceae bacterium]